MNMKKSILIPASIVLAASTVGTVVYQESAKQRASEITKSFKPFEPKVTTRSDDQFFYVQSDGMPDHELMVGIVAWQQQVPLPQSYRGNNSWQFPLFPKPAANPKSAKDGFFRGAIAIAANGVPIFNPIKNDGRTDTLLAGELDEYGGHSGRGDDYHYHVAPLFLQDKLGKDLPVAFALDGYPLFGLTCENGKVPTDLDAMNGHITAKRGYHYHATKTYPYLNGGFHGEVTERGGQVEPQPRATSPREALPPLRGAKITGFKRTGQDSYSLTYTLNGNENKVNYTINKDGSYRFEFVDADGKTRVENYAGLRQRGGGRSSGGGDKDPEPKGPDPGAPRKPWIYAHAKELDTNQDGTVLLTEVNDLIRAAFKEVAGTKQEIGLDALKQARPARNVIGGYLKQHADEFDEDANKVVTLQEVLDEFASLFHKADKNHDHALSKEEIGE